MKNNLSRYWLFLLFVIASVHSNAQQNDAAQKKFYDSLMANYELVKSDTLGHSYMVVQFAASFRGGLKGWTDYLSKNLNTDLGSKYIKLKKGDSTARQTAIVSFIVSPTGIISDVTAEPVKGMELHPKLAAEAIRVVAEGPRWEPAIQEKFEVINGKIPMEQILEKRKKGFTKVIYRHKQSITFVVTK